MATNALTVQQPVEYDYSHRHGLPFWKDQALSGKSILVFDEQELSDTILLSRYLAKLKTFRVRVVFEARPELFNLFVNWPLVDEVVLSQKTMAFRSSCHYCIPLAGLPARFQTNPGTIPQNIPYLFADPENAARWSSKMSGIGLKVGLVGMESGSDRFSGFNLERLDPLWQIDGLEWYNLQKGLSSNDNIDLHGRPLIQLRPDFHDFSDIAAVIANFDLVIAVDPAFTHLAGAMGKPVWTILPLVPSRNWHQEGKQSPLYPSLRLYRQTADGDWDGPVVEMAHDLRQFKHARSHSLPKAIADQCYATALSQQKQGDLESAEAGYRNLLSSVADHHPALSALALIYLKTQRYSAAVHTLRKALELNPVDHLGLNNLGNAFHCLGQIESALSAYAGAIACRPDYPNAYHNLGNVFLDLNDINAVVNCYAKALEINPTDAGAQWEMGKLYLKKLDTSNARKHFEQCVALAPQFVPARISLATTALLQGDFSVGWDQYRWRFKDESLASTTYPAKFDLSRWQGKPFKNKHMIIHCEQGFGDTIQFARFIPRVKALGGMVTFQVQDSLMPLFRHFPGIDVLQRLPEIQPATLDADLYCPLMDVPFWLEVSAETIAADTPYITADPEKADRWRRRIDPDRFAVGIVWAGNPDHANDHHRSCPLGQLLELERIDGIHLYSLQKQVGESDGRLLAAQPHTTLLGSDLNDFGDTAAVIENLDLVISVDTAVAHLAGAMGKPVWLILPYAPDWRWMLWRTDTPWYPSMQLFRQPNKNRWKPVIQSVIKYLKDHINESGS
jgi:tetratricopeptide (TPR) repeat protein